LTRLSINDHISPDEFCSKLKRPAEVSATTQETATLMTDPVTVKPVGVYQTVNINGQVYCIFKAETQSDYEEMSQRAVEMVNQLLLKNGESSEVMITSAENMEMRDKELHQERKCSGGSGEGAELKDEAELSTAFVR